MGYWGAFAFDKTFTYNFIAPKNYFMSLLRMYTTALAAYHNNHQAAAAAMLP